MIGLLDESSVAAPASGAESDPSHSEIHRSERLRASGWRVRLRTWVSLANLGEKCLCN
jgi:hypothetical protein